MARLPKISGNKAIQVLEGFGFVKIRQKGSHVILKKTSSAENIGCVVPVHKELAEGTLRGILRQARISNKEFVEKFYH